jgi:dynein heavy chain
MILTFAARLHALRSQLSSCPCCLQRESLIKQLDSKLELIFQKYGLEVLNVQEDYQLNKDTPVIARHATPVAGAIGWSRHLLQRLQEPMQHFQQHAKVRDSFEAS